MKKIALAVLMLATAAGTAVAADGERRSGHPGGYLAQVDTNGDGEIDAAEFAVAGAKRAADQFDEIDVEKTGTISKDQFVKAGEAEAKARFEKMDRNTDGKLTKEDRPTRPEGKHEQNNEAPADAPAQ